MADESEEEPETLVEEQPEVVPSLASVDPECVEWVKSNVDLPGVRKTDLKWEPEHEETIAEFIASTAHRRLFAWSDPKHGLSLSTAAPQSEHEHLQYFLKPETVLTSENIAQVVQFGTVQGAPVYGEGLYQCGRASVCGAPDTCVCAPGWTGYDCSIPTCAFPGAAGGANATAPSLHE